MEVALVFVDVVQGFTFVQNSENRLAERGKNNDGSEHIHTSFLKEAVMVKATGLASIASDRWPVAEAARAEDGGGMSNCATLWLMRVLHSLHTAASLGANAPTFHSTRVTRHRYN